MTTRGSRKGIVLAGGAGTRLHPVTLAVSKQLVPVYDKPMIYYPLSTLMLAGIREMLLISTPHDAPAFQSLLRDGSQWGLSIQYAIQERPAGIAQAFVIGADFIANDPVTLVLGDNIFYGQNLSQTLQTAAARRRGATVFGYYVRDPARYGVARFGARGRVVDILEKPARPPSNYAITGLYFYDADVCDVAAQIPRSARGELEISDVNAWYLKEQRLTVEKLGRGYAWLDTGTPSSLLRAAQFVETVEDRQGLQIGSPEEVAWRKGYIDDAGLARLIEPIKDSEYGKYLQRLLAQG